MPALALPSRRPAVVSPVLLVILGLAMAIAFVGPFDTALPIATGDAPLLRILLIAGLTLAGAACARAAGLSLAGTDVRWPLIALTAAAAVAAYVCVIDSFLFRNVLPLGYVHYIQGHSLRDRLSYYFLRAFQENVVYRLFVFSALISLICRIRHTTAGRLSGAEAWTIAFLVQLGSVWINVMWGEPMSATLLAYDVLRYVLPGALWGWLYWRFGFATIEVAHVSCHAFLQPALGAFL